MGFRVWGLGFKLEQRVWGLGFDARRLHVAEILNRTLNAGFPRLNRFHVFFQVRKTGRRDEDESWEPFDNLKLKDPYVLKLVKAYDEKMQVCPAWGLWGLWGLWGYAVCWKLRLRQALNPKGALLR